MRWNVTLVDEQDIKKNYSFTDKKYDNAEIFFTNLVSQNVVDLYFQQIQLSGEIAEKQSIKLSPAVSSTTTRLLQCIYRKDDENNLDILASLRELSAAFWWKLASIFLLLSLILIAVYFLKFYRLSVRRRSMGLKRRVGRLGMFLLLLYVRIITRQNNDRRLYSSNLNILRYLLLLVIILFSIVIHQVMFYTAFRDLKFRNTSYILRDLNQLLRDSELNPCFLESETVVASKSNNANSIMYKLYHLRKEVCFLSDVMDTKKNKQQGGAVALSRLLTNVLIGSDQYVEYFGYLFCEKYSLFIRTLLKQMLEKDLNKDLPLFWTPLFQGDETLQAFFISRRSSRRVQHEIYFKYVYRTFEHGWTKFLKYVKHKIYENNAVSECFTSNYDRVSFPYRWSELIPTNFSLIFNIAFTIYFVLFSLFVLNCSIAFLRPRLQIRWINVDKI